LSRRGALLVLVLGLALVVPATVSVAQSPPPVAVPENGGGGNGAGGFGGLDLKARAEGIDVLYDDDAQAFHPTGQGSAPETATTLSSGPVGTALSSVAWPGPLVADFGNAAQLQGAPEQAGAIKYPVRAQAFAPQGPADDSQGDFVAHADTARTEASAKATKFTSEGGLGAGQATTHSITFTKDGQAVAEATSVVNNFGVADVFTIDSVTTSAKVTANGKDAKAEGKTTVSGVKVAGQPATITDKGITVADSANPSPLDAVKKQVADQALQQAGINAFLVAPVQEKDGTGAMYTSGSVVITYTPAPGQLFTIRLGGATAKAAANQESLAPATDVATDVTVPPVAAAPVSSSSGGGTPSAPAGPTDAAPATDTPAAASAPSPSPPGAQQEAVALPEVKPVRFFGGLSPGVVIAFLAGAVLIGGALRRLADNVLAVSDQSACPLERTTP
jgi:hypothetical protein